jgi:long-chain fatty acid transport protein
MFVRQLIAAGLFACLCGNAWGSGFGISGKSVSGLGSALSGTTVLAEDASVVYSNPAAMRDLEGREFSALLHAIPADIHFEDSGSTTSGGSSEQVDAVHLVPGFYYVNTLNDQVSLGLGIYSPFGLGVDYDDNWVGRYHSTSSSLRTINISPALAFSAGERLNIGVGVDLQYAEADLQKAVDFGTICVAYEAMGAFPAGTCASQGLSPEQNDGSHKLTGRNWTVGYSLGLTYDLSEATRLGMSFHSATRHDVEGDSEFGGVPTLFSGAFHDSNASLTLMLPEVLSLGMRHTISPRLELMADYTWTRWSRYDELVVKFTNGLTPVVEEANWKDSSRYAIGMNYRWQTDWLLRAGILYDQTPIPDAQHLSPRVPDSDKLSLALGSNVAFSDRLDLDMAVFYTLPSNPEVDNTDSLGHTLKGDYEVQTTYFSVQLNWKL